MPENQSRSESHDSLRLGTKNALTDKDVYRHRKFEEPRDLNEESDSTHRFNFESGAPQSTRIPHRRFKNKCSTLLHLAHSFGRIINTEFSGKYQYFPNIAHEQTLHLKCIVTTIPLRLHLRCESGSIIKCIYDVTSRKKEPSWIRAKSAISV